MSGYDLLEVPDGYRADVVLLIAPYFDAKFVKTLVKKLTPSKIRFVIDDGVRGGEIEQLISACNGTPDVKVTLGVASGLVHLKGYYIEFVKIDGRGRRKRRFLYGSPNATDAAFHGRRNAELIAGVDLSAGEDSKFLNYLSRLIDAVENGSGQISSEAFGPLRNSPVLHFPTFRITSPGPSPGFDAWLQRGLLAAKYREAQQFLTVSVVLQKQLPQDLVSIVFANRGLLEPGGRNVVRFRYMSNGEDSEADELVDENDTEHEGTTSSQWKSRYCVWTHFGDWLSDDCYRAHSAGMVLKNGDRRRAKIEELLAHGRDKIWTERRKAGFTDALSSVWTELEKVGQPGDYLKGGRHGIDLAHYGDRFKKKLLADYRSAQDGDFRARYINGYEFPAVPRFRQDTASWDGFVRSWCESIALETSKRTPRSLLAKAVLAAIAKSDSDLEPTPEEIRDWLRKYWNVGTVGESVMAYYEPAPV